MVDTEKTFRLKRDAVEYIEAQGFRRRSGIFKRRVWTFYVWFHGPLDYKLIREAGLYRWKLAPKH